MWGPRRERRKTAFVAGSSATATAASSRATSTPTTSTRWWRGGGDDPWPMRRSARTRVKVEADTPRRMARAREDRGWRECSLRVRVSATRASSSPGIDPGRPLPERRSARLARPSAAIWRRQARVVVGEAPVWRARVALLTPWVASSSARARRASPARVASSFATCWSTSAWRVEMPAIAGVLVRRGVIEAPGVPSQERRPVWC